MAKCKALTGSAVKGLRPPDVVVGGLRFYRDFIVRRGGITNHRLIAYSLSNICAKNY